MVSRFLPLALLGSIAVPLAAQIAPPADPAPQATSAPQAAQPQAAQPEPGEVRVVLTTAAGPITLALDKAHAPLTVANFLRYLDAGRLNGATFYRAMTLGEGRGLVQGGAKPDARRPIPPVAHEPTTVTGLSHVEGTISMARGKPGTASSDFFIVVGDLTGFDADPKAPGDNLGFAAFGHVVDGMDVVRRILTSPVSPTAGQGAMRGQMLAPSIRIVTARRLR